MISDRIEGRESAMASVGATSKRVGGNSTGKNAPMIKGGYAKGPIPDVMVGTKPGLIQGSQHNVGYSGPDVAQGRFDS